MVIYSSPKSRSVATNIWDLKAFTTKELMARTGFSSRVIDHTRKNLTRIGLIRPTVELASHRGKGGRKPWVYAIRIATPQDSVEAKLRYDELINQERQIDQAARKAALQAAAEERRLRREDQIRRREGLIQTLVTEFSEQYRSSEKPIPVSLVTIEKRVRSVGLEGDDFLDVAVALESDGIETGYYAGGGEVDPSVLPDEIRAVREARAAKEAQK